MRKLNLLVPATLALVCAACVPALRADFFVSNGMTGQVLSYSQFTGAPKLSFTEGLGAATGVAIGPDGNLYVADLANRDVLRFNPSTGALIGTFVYPLPTAQPYGITFGKDGNLYMADHNGNIIVFDGSTGSGTGGTSCNCQPYDLTFGQDGNLYVSDQASGGVLRFNGSTLAFMSQFVSTNNVEETYIPGGLHFGPNGNLYVSF